MTSIFIEEKFLFNFEKGVNLKKLFYSLTITTTLFILAFTYLYFDAKAKVISCCESPSSVNIIPKDYEVTFFTITVKDWDLLLVFKISSKSETIYLGTSKFTNFVKIVPKYYKRN